MDVQSSGETRTRRPKVVLRGAVNELPFWHLDDDGRTHRSRLELDASRLSEAVEGWVPVKTPLGPGVLVWPNCD